MTWALAFLVLYATSALQGLWGTAGIFGLLALIAVAADRVGPEVHG